jgi:predicted P-loop ATPase
VLLYFPSIGIAIIEPKIDRRHILNEENIKDMDELYIKKELNAKPIYLDLKEDKFNIGYVINDILLEAKFAPSENFLESRGTY